METTMRISALGQATGVDIETIRYYEKIGLLPAPVRSDNGYRAYGHTHLERLAFIRHCRALDISLADVKRLLDFVAQPDADCADINRLIDAQWVRVRARLRSMRALERQLAALRARCNSRHPPGECGILHELVAAAHGEGCACHSDTSMAPTLKFVTSNRLARKQGG
uniref:Cd(II)/Pb(II)-responsive transcriptional regulator n=1 Tax=Verminephrobacter aporrectodeae TaxID=1110389 RepID=UPI002ADD83AF|nr:Cd(II)/Pb(II)-responsive transcriptional regulator [Verminephrobacter aporrectodeae]